MAAMSLKPKLDKTKTYLEAPNCNGIQEGAQFDDNVCYFHGTNDNLKLLINVKQNFGKWLQKSSYLIFFLWSWSIVYDRC